MSRLAVPALESVRFHKLFAVPEQEPADPKEDLPAETDAEFDKRKKAFELVAAIEIGILYISRDKVIELGGLSRKIGLQEKRRVKELKKEFSKEDYPELYKVTFQSEEGGRETLAWQRTVLKQTVRGLRGLDAIVDGKKIDAAEIEDVEKLIGILEIGGWSFGAALLAIRLQTPGEEQLLASEL